ncbi:hypothetical protein C7B80_29380 [Cyanosarcina cf. burmensis CCALA 770]|nr:hypothetical protein C7B80_29380 [Cyanosarcina cf. burmensis CCALA 770]
MAALQESSVAKLLGAGRSGKVFLVESQSGAIARKIFYPDTIANIIHYFFFGSPNPYIWNKDAIACAFYRRKILGELVQFWFGDRLTVTDALSTKWNQEFKAYQIDTEFIKGRHVSLLQPCSRERAIELPALVRGIMLPLQKKLIEAGLDGLVWQAGKGTPTALNNFLLASDTSNQPVFVWIDLESGVPALFPINIIALFSFYLPKTLKYKRAMFDDVDNYKLKRYIHNYQVELVANIGSQKYQEVLGWVDRLEYHQDKWKSMRRVDRSIQYQLKKGAIDEQQARWYSEHFLLWYTRGFWNIFQKIINQLLIQLPIALVHKIINIPYLQFFYNLWRFILSQRYRINIVRNYVARRIERWRDRKHLRDEEANSLLQSLEREKSSEYLTDFGVHLGIKLFVKIIEYVLVPLLYFVGLINELVFITWLIVGGPVYRTIYTSWRALQAAIARQEIPWVALLVGLIPTAGILAYPCQIIWSAKGKKQKIAQFIVYDFFTRIGAKIPAWGGEDTNTEHFFNQIADKIANRQLNRRKPLESAKL